MARLIKVIDKAKHHEISMMQDGTIAMSYTIIDWHWELVDTSYDEVAYFQGLMDNE